MDQRYSLIHPSSPRMGITPDIMPVPKVGIEPTLLTEHDFESCASACSATSALRYTEYIEYSQKGQGFTNRHASWYYRIAPIGEDHAI